MGSLSEAYDNHALDSMLGSDRSNRFPATVYVGLVTTMPTKTTAGVECAGGGYARVAVANTDANWPDAVGAQKSNGAAFAFPTLTASWGTIVGWAIYDHITDATAADIIAFNDIVPSQTPVIGDTPEFPIGSMIIEAQ